MIRARERGAKSASSPTPGRANSSPLPRGPGATGSWSSTTRQKAIRPAGRNDSGADPAPPPSRVVCGRLQWGAAYSLPPDSARTMSEVTRALAALGSGDPAAAGQLLPLVYDELRKLAAAKLAHEKPGQTLQPTALVHEAYLRLVGGDPAQPWAGRGHFFAAAAEAMRRILVERARKKGRQKRGGGRRRVDLTPAAVAALPPGDLLDLDAALAALAA